MKPAVVSGLLGFVLGVSVSASATAHAQAFVDTIASEREMRLTIQGLNEGNVPSISNDGTVAFAGTTPLSASAIIVGDADALWPIDMVSRGLSRPRSIKVNDDALVFIADAPSARGVYTVKRTGGSVTPVHVEGGAGKLPTMSDVALAHNSTVAFATVCSDCMRGGGGVFIGPLLGAMRELQHGAPAGFLYNSQYLDLNEAGQVALQAEYLPDYKRGIFVLSRPGEPVASVGTVAEGLASASQPRPAINDRNQIAYVLDRNQVIVGTPTPYGTAKSTRVFADTSGPYASFERADIDNEGNVVFEATLDDGRKGIFVGPDPNAHKVVVDGDDMMGTVITRVLAMGQINNQRQVALFATVAPGDSRVLRISEFPASPR